MFKLESYAIANLWQGIDRMKVMRLVAVHDLGESIVGDITPSDGIDKRELFLSPLHFTTPKAHHHLDEKYLREELAFEYMQCLLVDEKPAFANEIMALWKEFEEGQTPEAKRARELNAFECLLQADEYEERFKKNLDDFMELEKRITSLDLRQLWTSLERERKARRARQDSIDLIIFVIGLVLRSLSFACANQTAGGPGIGKGTV